MKYQYYEKVSLLKNRDGRNTEGSRDFNLSDVGEKATGKRQIIYKIGDEE